MAMIAQSNSAPVFDFSESVFNFMPLFVEDFVVLNRNFTVLFPRDTGFNPDGA